jgi:hypothetical protein
MLTPPQIKPGYIRMPKSGTACPHSSLSRSALDLLVRPQEKNNFKPPVASRLLRQTGDKKHIRLINYQSLMRYLKSLPATEEEVRS